MGKLNGTAIDPNGNYTLTELGDAVGNLSNALSPRRNSVPYTVISLSSLGRNWSPAAVLQSKLKTQQTYVKKPNDS